MKMSIRVQSIACCLLGVLLLGGCSKEEDQQAPAGGGLLASQGSILQYVPADTPYVIANVESLPDALLDKLEPRLDEILKAYQAVLRETVKVAANGDEVGGDARKLSAIVDELASLMSIEGLRGAGLDRDSKAVVYGVGLLPVLRIEVSDAALFEAALARIEEQAGEKLPVARIGDAAFRYAEADKVKVILGTFGKQVVLALLPSSFNEEQVGEVLGLTPPPASIAGSGKLRDIAKEYGFTSHYVGFVDFARLVSTLSGDASGLDAALLDLMGDARPQLSNVCRAEIRSLGAIAPRLVLGYKEVNANRVSGQAVLELRDDIAAGLVLLPAAVPGLGSDPGGLMSFGMSIDVMAARKFYESRLDAMEKDPFECELLAELQSGIAAGRQALSQPVPPMIYDFKGFLAVIEDLKGLDLANNTPPTSIDGRVLLAMDNAPAVLALGAMFSPELAALDPQPDGKPVPFSMPQMQAVVDSAYVALTDDAVAISFGAGREKDLPGMLAADAAKDGTVMSFSMDASRYYAFIGEAMALAEADEDQPMPPEFRDAMNNMMISLSRLYDRMSTDVRLSKRGVEVDSAVTIKD